MDVVLDRHRIAVESDDALDATVLAPQHELPGVMFVHGWGGSQEQDLSRAREVAALGCVCLTFDLRGHRANAMRKETVTREQNLRDLFATYDWLAALPQVDRDTIAVIGISYGGYLASILTQSRSVRWLGLRTPALYLDRNWDIPKRRLHDDPELDRYRHRALDANANLALRACSQFKGDVLLVEAEHDQIIPRQVIDNYARAFGKTRSMTRRQIEGADHGFNDKPAQRLYSDVLMAWMTEMVVGARGAIAASKVREFKVSKRADAP